MSELIEYENTQGRQSIGAISELFLENIDTNAFADAAAALDFCYQNSHLIDITVSDLDTSVNPKWFNTPYRYAANSDGYFAVGDYVFRLFDEGIVMVSAENYTDLLNLDDQTNFRDLDESTYLFQPYFYAGTSSDPHGSCPFGTYFSNTKTSGSDRVNLVLRTSQSGFMGFGSTTEAKICVNAQHKCMGIWWASRRTLTLQGDVDCHRRTGSSNWVTDSYYGFNITKKTTQINYPITMVANNYGYGYNNYH